jgi:L-aminopeptidase/D-esterase-like protein
VPRTAGCEVLWDKLDIPAVGVGCVGTAADRTGVTVVTLPDGTRGAVDVRGGAPATRETECLRPENLVRGPHAVCLAGGSAFGLEAAGGVMQALAAAGRGVAFGGARIPIVPAAAIFDVAAAESGWPDAAAGRQAADLALQGNQEVPRGRHGAGSGATVGKALGPERAMPGGQAAVTLVAPDGLRVAAVAVVNALGSVVAEDGQVLAGPRAADAAPVATTPLIAVGRPQVTAGEATTLVLVATDAGLDKAALLRVAQMAQDGLGRAIEPAHTLYDGDSVFALATGDRPQDATRVGALAAQATALAIRRAVTAGEGRPG